MAASEGLAILSSSTLPADPHLAQSRWIERARFRLADRDQRHHPSLSSRRAANANAPAEGGSKPVRLIDHQQERRIPPPHQ
jgi:hypothetical protein